MARSAITRESELGSEDAAQQESSPGFGNIPQVFIDSMRSQLLSREEINYGGPLSLLVEYWKGEPPNYAGWHKIERVNGLTGEEIKVIRKVAAASLRSQPDI